MIDILTKHAYLPTIMITDTNPVFNSNVIHEIIDVLDITLHHPTPKHAQTIGGFERKHATTKMSLKIISGGFRTQSHKHLPLAISNYKTTYHKSVICKPSRIFHGRVPYNILDHKLGLKFKTVWATTLDFADELLRRKQILYKKKPQKT